MCKLIVSGFADEYSPDLEQQIAGFKKLGIHCIELRMVNGKNIADLTEAETLALAERLQAEGIRVTAVGSPIGKIYPEDDFEQHLERAKRCFHNANILGASFCRVFSFYGLSEEETFARMEKLLSLADAAGLILCHENEAGIYGESPEACLKLLQHFDRRLEAVFDGGNFVLGGYDAKAAYALLQPYVRYFHIKDAKEGVILPAGEGDAAIAELLHRHLTEVGGEVIASLEPHLHDFAGLKSLSPEQLSRAHTYKTPAEAFTAGAEAFFKLPQVTFSKEKLSVKGYSTREGMGHAAALEIAECLRKFLKEQEEVNVIFAAAPSQNETLAHLVVQTGIDWSRINAFHMDEYIGLNADAPQCFSNFLEDAIFGRVPFKRVFKLNPAADPEEEIARYSALLEQHPVDIVCMGIGENGHIAFNDPGVADFYDPHLVKRALLDEVCRNQQVHDGCFAALKEVPTEALTLTVPALMAGKVLFCMVPGPTKRQAVRQMIEGEIGEDCPCTILRTHPDATLYCDQDSLGDFR